MERTRGSGPRWHWGGVIKLCFIKAHLDISEKIADFLNPHTVLKFKDVCIVMKQTTFYHSTNIMNSQGLGLSEKNIIQVTEYYRMFETY